MRAFNPSRYERAFDVRLVLSGTVIVIIVIIVIIIIKQCSRNKIITWKVLNINFLTCTCMILGPVVQNMNDTYPLYSKFNQWIHLHCICPLNKWVLENTCERHIAIRIPTISLNNCYSAAQICPNQNIRVMRVGPIRVYAYAYTHIRVCIYAHTRIQYIRVCLIGMYELTYCFFFSYRSLLFSMA